MDFYRKYISQTEFSKGVLSLDKLGNPVPEKRIVLPDADYALCEMLFRIKLVIENRP